MLDVHLGLTDSEYLSLASSIVDEIEDGSVFFSTKEEANNEIQRIDPSKLDLGNVLGNGGFCNVHELLNGNEFLEIRSTNSMTRDSFTEGSTIDGGLIAKDSKLQGQQQKFSPLVVKKIRNSFSGKIQTRALIDLSCEIKFLSALSHRNIIKLRGISSEDGEGTSITNNSTFIVLDRIYLTLDEQMKFWKSSLKRHTALFKITFFGVNPMKVGELKLDRLTAATDLSSALEYLHRHKIIYRDLKPENIGFDERGILKLFDFGLCKELRSKDLANDTVGEELYNLTGFVGCLPYMAPEVYLGDPYNTRADVYSFGLLLCEMLTLKSFSKRRNIISEKQIHVGSRPEVPKRADISMALSNLITKCWSNNSFERPDMRYVHSVLNSELERLVDEI